MSIISFTPQYLISHSFSTEFSNDYLSLLALYRFSFLFSIFYFFETGPPVVQGSLKLQSQGKLGGPELISSFQVPFGCVHYHTLFSTHFKNSE